MCKVKQKNIKCKIYFVFYKKVIYICIVIILKLKNLIMSLTNKTGGNGSLITQEQMQTLEQAGIIPQSTPASQVEVFAKVCAEHELSPFSKEIYLVGYKGKYSVITGINGFRKIAGRTGTHAGTDQAKFDLQPNGQYKTVASYSKGQLPTSCSITVYKIVQGVRCPFEHTAKFSEFSSGRQKWASMPFQMIAKVAEAFALRKAFGGELSGLSISEEGAALADDTIEIKYSENQPPTLEQLQQMVQRAKACQTDDCLGALLEKANKFYNMAGGFDDALVQAFDGTLLDETISNLYKEDENG